jgi:quinol monooxygenase YgiN
MSEVVVVATLHAAAGKEEAFEAELRKLFEPTHGEEGCHLFAMHRSVDDPAVYCVIERWESRDRLDHHLQSAHIREYVAATADLLAEPIRIDLYTAAPVGDPVKGRLS